MKTKLLSILLLLSCLTGYAQVSTSLQVQDTRNVDDAPDFNKLSVRFDFKRTAVVHIPGVDSYSGQLTLSPWADASGGVVQQLNFNQGGIFARTSTVGSSTTWNAWQQIPTIDPNKEVVTIDKNAGVYPNIINYHINGTPTKGVKIKTNIPFQNSYNMPLVKIEGYDYGSYSVLNLDVAWYVYNNAFYASSNVSSMGGSTPKVILANEGGKIVIFLDEKISFQRFTVSAFSRGLSGDNPAYFTGWTVVDEAISGSTQMILPYKNNFGGDINVNGIVHAKEVKIDTNFPAADYVFDKDYKLPSLAEVKKQVDEQHHLEGIPSAAEIKKEGVDIAVMQNKLLQKIEELTLYTIKQDEQIKEQNKRADQQEKEIQNLKNEMKK